MRRLALATVLVSLATFAALAAAEGVLRTWRPLWTVDYPPINYRPDLFERHDPYGYRLRPARTCRNCFLFAHVPRPTITSNAEGFRSRHDFHPPTERTRVVVLGDSMVFGVGVEEEDRLTERLAEREPGWRVDNVGMLAYGPDLMLRALEAVGLDPPPAVVVLAMFSHDVYRVAPEASGAGFPSPRYVLDGGRLLTVPYPEGTPWLRLRVVQAARYVWWRYSTATFPLNEAILDRFRALAAAHRFAPVLLFLPARHDGFDDRRRRAWLRGYADAHGVPFLDLTEPLHAAGVDRLYLEADSHWNAAGHRAVADLVHPLVAAALGR
jgi:hypothetical protein